MRLSVADRCNDTRKNSCARNGCTARLSYCNAMLPTTHGHVSATRKIFAPSIASKRNREAERRKTFSQKISPRASKEPQPPSQTLESRPTDSPPRGRTPVSDVTRSRTIRTAATHQCGSRSRCSRRPRSSKTSDAPHIDLLVASPPMPDAARPCARGERETRCNAPPRFDHGLASRPGRQRTSRRPLG
jgi:hypothetical protein